ncbi:hypothetical protein F5X97DRAFT_327286 [Nemania serpens]|nr:hypothetical protein F5X97DRAFT_327286 [Nemania serpens]
MMFSSRHIFAVVVALVGAVQARRQIPRYLAIPRSSATYVAQLATGTGVAVNDGTATSSISTGYATLPPFANTTTAAAGTGLTTLTISATSVGTIISCAPTVTNCPALSGTGAVTSLPEGVSTELVTTVIGVTTTVCPVTEATAVSSSVLASFSSPAPTGTGAASTYAAAGPGAEDTGAISAPATSAPCAGAVTETVTNVVTTTVISISTVEVPGTCGYAAATAAAGANSRYKLRRVVPY